MTVYKRQIGDKGLYAASFRTDFTARNLMEVEVVLKGYGSPELTRTMSALFQTNDPVYCVADKPREEWRCLYCAVPNAVERVKCEQCGAPRNWCF